MSSVALPVVVPIVTALALLASNPRPRWQQRIAVMGGLALVVVAVSLLRRTLNGEILVHPVGSWAPQIGIVWVVDRLAAVMLTVASLTSLAVIVFARASMGGRSERRRFHPIHQLVVLGVNGSFVTGDLFNLFVFFEVMLIASFVAMTLSGRPTQLEAAFPYVVLNLVASGLLFTGVGIAYCTSGTVNMAELSIAARSPFLPPAFWAGLTLAVLVFAVKAALVPFFFWLPDSYPQAPLPVNAFFGGLLAEVGVYALYRVLTLTAGPGPGPTQKVLLAVAAATMLIGVLGALGRKTIRGILSFHIVSQVGYMVFGLALFTPRGIGAGLFFMVHNMLVKTALLLTGGIVERVAGGGKLGRVRGFAALHPWTAALGFFLPAMALAGIPPLSGFWGKLFLMMAGFESGSYIVTGIAVVVSLLTLASMLKIWFASFWGAPGGRGTRRRVLGHLVLPPAALALLSLLMGLAAPPLWRQAERTGRELLGTSAYVSGVRTAIARGQSGGPPP